MKTRQCLNKELIRCARPTPLAHRDQGRPPSGRAGFERRDAKTRQSAAPAEARRRGGVRAGGIAASQALGAVALRQLQVDDMADEAAVVSALGKLPGIWLSLRFTGVRSIRFCDEHNLSFAEVARDQAGRSDKGRTDYLPGYR